MAPQFVDIPGKLRLLTYRHHTAAMEEGQAPMHSIIGATHRDSRRPRRPKPVAVCKLDEGNPSVGTLQTKSYHLHKNFCPDCSALPAGGYLKAVRPPADSSNPTRPKHR